MLCHLIAEVTGSDIGLFMLKSLANRFCTKIMETYGIFPNQNEIRYLNFHRFLFGPLINYFYVLVMLLYKHIIHC